MHRSVHKKMEAPNIRETTERTEREQHMETDSPYKIEESTERIIQEEAQEFGETDKEEKLQWRHDMGK